MVWSFLIIVAITSVSLAVFAARKWTRDRRRSANWNNLHERGKLITAQLSAMRDVATRRETSESGAKTTPDLDTSANAKLFWARQSRMLQVAPTPLLIRKQSVPALR